MTNLHNDPILVCDVRHSTIMLFGHHQWQDKACDAMHETQVPGGLADLFVQIPRERRGTAMVCWSNIPLAKRSTERHGNFEPLRGHCCPMKHRTPAQKRRSICCFPSARIRATIIRKHMHVGEKTLRTRVDTRDVLAIIRIPRVSAHVDEVWISLLVQRRNSRLVYDAKGLPAEDQLSWTVVPDRPEAQRRMRPKRSEADRKLNGHEQPPHAGNKPIEK
ncbi:hypothetical protein DAEQUDRAFT_723314 [Daedalea quercina L-15889]|uniref:Uncharacterized protein n=1 Tax=Daedalea quercina L-15889 TaxID=1314783 RepID=A0A165SKZ4_9APHY|nr:hypothetical protein DAEQUDRAFT_723314 [Daedalea quercina L-15889]